jgi:predicted enzyme related to lactoylglutathione lyase
MFKDTKAFSSFSVNDLQVAKKFYSQTLGLDVSEKTEGLELEIPGGGKAFIYPKSNHQPATFTVLNFKVNDIHEAVNDLSRKGVSMEHYDQENLKTDAQGIFHPRGPHDGPTIAWFKDPAGNILSVVKQKAA